MPFLIAFLVLLAVLIAVLIIRTLTFKPKAEVRPTPEAVFVNTEKAVADLSEMIKCRTVSDRNKDNEDEKEFDKFKALLERIFPSVYSKCVVEYVGTRAILIKWSGKSSAAPTVLMSHFDVVSVVEENWTKPAFEGIVENGVLWGRGTLDTKGTLNGALQAAESLIADGFVPENDIYFAFGGDEEINGQGSPSIVKLFKERGIVPGLVVDEGGAVVENVFPGVKAPAAVIGIAEKGMLNVEYSVSGGGGHSSAPKPNTPVARLARACVAVEKKPFKFRMSPAARAMFDTLGRHSTFVYRLIFANLWFFSPVLNILTKKTGGELNALVRTTVAFTQMEGSKGINVIPPVAKMASNSRLNFGETCESAMAHIRKAVKDEGVEIRQLEGTNPSVISTVDCDAYRRLKNAVEQTWVDAIVTPYPMVACSDSRHWGVLSDKVYRFSAMALSNEERATIHGNDEKIPVGTIAKTVEFYIRLIKSC